MDQTSAKEAGQAERAAKLTAEDRPDTHAHACDCTSTRHVIKEVRHWPDTIGKKGGRRSGNSIKKRAAPDTWWSAP